MSSPALPRHRQAPDSPRADDPRPRTVNRRAGGTPAGRYRYDAVTGAWWWSPEMRRLLGLAPAAEPCTEALLSAHHPADSDRVRKAVAAACDRGRPFALETRILDPARGQRSIVLIGEPFADERGDVRGVEGVCADVTASRPVETEADRSEALQAEITQMHAAMASRAVIEQAKGILMLLTSCREQGAFDLLTHISSHTHRKVRDVAQSLAESAAGDARLPGDVAGILRDACPPVRPVD